jgi:hypothetical protein
MPTVMTITAKATIVEYLSEVPSEKVKKQAATQLLRNARATVVAISEAETDDTGKEPGKPHLVWRAAWIHDGAEVLPNIPNFEFSKN